MKKVLLLLLIFCLLSLGACGKSEEKTSNDDSIVVIDMAGNKVAVPSDTVNNTVATTYGVITPFYVTLQMSNRVLATTIKNKSFMRMADERIVEAGDIGNLSIDAEALAAYAPDVLMIRTSNDDKKQIGERLGIPTISVYIETAEQVKEAYDLIGKVFGKEERAKELNDWIDNELNEIKKLRENIKEDERYTAICMGSRLGQIAGSNMLQIMMIECAGGKSEVSEVADDLMWVDVGVENVFSKNPDFIFVSSSYPAEYTIEGLFNDSAWSALKAIKNKHVYSIPAKFDSWDMPGPAFVLGTYYMMHCMYPELVDSEMMQTKTNEFYKLFYGRTFTGEEIGYSF